jgi:hypothetical protein
VRWLTGSWWASAESEWVEFGGPDGVLVASFEASAGGPSAEA